MQKVSGLLVVGILIAVLLCGVVSASVNLTATTSTPPNGRNIFLVGDTVTISGMNHISDITHIRIVPYKTRIAEYYQVNVGSDGTWHYSITPQPDTYEIIIMPVSEEESIKIYRDTGVPIESVIIGFSISKSMSTPAPTPTPIPTPDYEAKIAALETRIAAQETKIQTQATQIQQIAARTPEPTTIPTTAPTTVITTKTPVPTQTVDYEATLAAIQKQIDEQNDIIYQILHFLGLR